MPALLALLPEIIDAILTFGSAILEGGAWWQIPVSIGLFKVQDQLTQHVPSSPSEQSPVQAAGAGVAAAVGGVGQGVGSAAAGAGQGIGGIGQFLGGDGKWLVLGAAALILVTRR